jgi:hypothetical protein
LKSFYIQFYILILVTSTILFAQPDKYNKIKSPDGIPSYTYLNINNISTVFINNGISDNFPNEYKGGFVYPKGSKKIAVYVSGLIWGAFVEGDPQVRVGGSTYLSGLQGGKILSLGVEEDPEAEHVRIYRVCPDVYPGGPSINLSVEAIDEGKTEEEVRTQYELDWIEWRAIDGAPFTDMDGDGVYNPDIDIPGIPDAGQTIWFVANDQSPQLTSQLYGSLPLGIEYQATYWAYKTNSYLDNIIFRKYILINKSNTTFNDMYISMWSDTDIGDLSDDYAGCDTLLDMMYSYNADEIDKTYEPYPPPAVGFSLLDGPSVQNDSTLPMTASYYLVWGDPTNPILPYESGVRIYNNMRGRIGLTGEFFMDPLTGLPTTFALPGNPITGEGWIDGLLVGPSDRRNGLASGPFQMAVGDTQEVIIAEIAALGQDRLHSVQLLKYYTSLLRDEFDNEDFLVLPPKPPNPELTVDDEDRMMKFNWGKNTSLTNSIENFNSEGYTFQGYNVYQLQNNLAFSENAIRIATYDIIDGITEIPGLVPDPETGLLINGIKQFGSDSGIKRTFSTNYDYIENERMIVGKKYYFAVTAYTYNPNPEKDNYTSESLINVIETTYYDELPGAEHGDNIEVLHSSGIGDADIIITVDDPTKLTGDDYRITFHTQDQIRDESGNWVPGSETIRKYSPLAPDTLTGTKIDIAPVYGGIYPNSINLNFHLEVVHHYYGWVDGVTLTFPPGTQILDVPDVLVSGSYGTPEPVVITDNVVRIGITDNSQTQGGHFHEGGEDWVVTVPAYDTMWVDWEVHDDGYAGGQNELGTTIVSNEIGYVSRLANLYNLINTTTHKIVLEDGSVYNGIDLFPRRDGDPILVENPIVDGFQLVLDVIWDPPLTISQYNAPTLNGTELSPYGVRWTNVDWTICDFTYFGYADGFANTTLPLYGGGGGTLIVDILQQDYELRWTGVLADTVINGVTVTYTQSGGSIATFIGASNYDWNNDHPFNPAPGSGNDFTLRVPVEVWNLDTDMQVNLIMYDRNAAGLQFTDDEFRTWNVLDRVYTWILNTPYSEDLIDDNSQTVINNATWNLVFYHSEFTLGDVVRIYYDNPIQFGVDEFTFTAPAAVDTLKGLPYASTYKLFQNFPNPFNPVTKIRFHIPEDGNVKLDVYDILGQRVAKLINSELAKDSYEILFDGKNLASGVYIYTLNVNNKFFDAKKMLLLK